MNAAGPLALGAFSQAGFIPFELSSSKVVVLGTQENQQVASATFKVAWPAFSKLLAPASDIPGRLEMGCNPAMGPLWSCLVLRS